MRAFDRSTRALTVHGTLAQKRCLFYRLLLKDLMSRGLHHQGLRPMRLRTRGALRGLCAMSTIVCPFESDCTHKITLFAENRQTRNDPPARCTPAVLTAVTHGAEVALSAPASPRASNTRACGIGNGGARPWPRRRRHAKT